MQRHLFEPCMKRNKLVYLIKLYFINEACYMSRMEKWLIKLICCYIITNFLVILGMGVLLGIYKLVRLSIAILHTVLHVCACVCGVCVSE